MGSDNRRLFDDRLAQSDANQYRDKSPLTWVKVTRNYLISRCREADSLLKWSIAQGENKITINMVIDLRSAGWEGAAMTDLDPLAFSEQLWGFMNLQIRADPMGPAKLGRQKFENVEALNGLEAWRRMVFLLESKSLATRHALQQLVQSPVRAAKLEDVEAALEVWDSNLTKYIEAGGPEMIECEKVGVALRVMPVNVEHSIIRSLRTSVDYETLKDNLDEEIKFLQEHRKGPSMQAAVVDNEDDDDDEYEDDHDDPADPALITAMLEAVGDNVEMQSQVLAFANGKFKKPFKSFAKKPVKIDMKRDYKRPTPPNGTGTGAQRGADAKDPNCINCGKRGHRTDDCPEGRKEKSQRPCFRCGKLGHMIANCPEKPAANLVANVTTAKIAGKTFLGVMTDNSAKERRPRPAVRTIGKAMRINDLRETGGTHTQH